MNPTIEERLELFADYFQFYLQDEEVEGNLGEAWTEDASNQLLAIADGTIGIGTARNMNVPVTIKLFNEDPGFELDPENLIDQINECDLEIRSGKIVVAGCTDYFPTAKRIKVPSGVYRVRLYYGNLEKLSEDGLDGEDFYEIHLWQSDTLRGLAIVKDRLASR